MAQAQTLGPGWLCTKTLNLQNAQTTHGHTARPLFNRASQRPTTNSQSMTQHFLFLQGVCSPFFPRLATALRRQGHAVTKANFTVGDRVYWQQGQALNYRGSMENLPHFYQQTYSSLGITDIVLFGDCRPIHRPAISLARSVGMRIHVFEEGYFRPHWITLEREGVNGNSTMPRDPAWYREQANQLPHYDNGQPFNTAFWKRAAYDVGYNFWAGLNPILHYGVRSHIPYSPLTEYLGYARRGLRLKYYAKDAKKSELALLAEKDLKPFFLLPLQLATDAQIVHHSQFASMAEAAHYVMQSFALHAPSHTRLAIKIHPLDPGLVNYRRLTKAWARQLQIPDRVFFLESGNLPPLLTHTAGVITVNSTVGASAILHGKRTIALGRAIYDMAGLTYQGELDHFWSADERPDLKLFKAFRNVVIHTCQLNGGFYCARGIDLAIAAALPRLQA
ncbi:capsule biosynthesis protein [Achromobacter sp. NPDC008082]|uniref:capsule biosynthesis protein n=1 Tax=Achromobacter sp. NPDC008082 TaxID=3363888 RepID=UPI0036F0DDAF